MPDPDQDSGRTIKQHPRDGLDYAWIPPGEFQMGAVPADSEAGDGEEPRHEVEITRGFWMSRSPVTAGAYRRFSEDVGRRMPAAPSFNENWEKPDHPIVNVKWKDARDYCEWAGGRLPTEAEWEYAARGGKEGLKYPWGDEISARNAKYDSADGTAPAGSYAANGFDLFDMAGNVYGWCSDWYGPYQKGKQTDPTGPADGKYKVLRGGSWSYDYPRYLRCSNRYFYPPDYWLSCFGIRCVREAPF